MNLFNLIKKGWGNGRKGKEYARIFSNYTPIFTQFGEDIYASDVVQQALACIVQEIKKLSPKHVVEGENGDLMPVKDSIQRTLQSPNPLMTTSDFLEKVMWSLFFNYNAFVLPVWDNGVLISLYPLNPVQVDFLEDKTGKLYISFRFQNNYSCTLKYSDIIHVRHNFSVNDLMGGDKSGRPSYRSLLETLELNKTLLDGVGKALKSSFAINGIVKYNTVLDGDKTQEAIQKLEEHLQGSESGLLGMDLKGEFIPLTRQTKFVDADTLKFIDEKILRNFGVPLNILTGDFTAEEFAAFYQKTLEPIVVSLSQAFTKALFSSRESFGYGHRIVFYEKELVFLNTQQKLEMATLLSNQGLIYANELRTMFGLTPLEELVGVRMQSLNWVDSKDASLYQVGESNPKEETDEKA